MMGSLLHPLMCKGISHTLSLVSSKFNPTQLTTNIHWVSRVILELVWLQLHPPVSWYAVRYGNPQSLCMLCPITGSSLCLGSTCL